MPVQTTSVRTTLAGNGSATSFPFPFHCADPATISVLYTDPSGARITLSPSSYSVTLNAPPAVGGWVTYPLSGSPIPAGSTLTITRRVPLTQDVELTNQAGFYPSVINGALDRLAMADQQLAEEQGRALRLPAPETVSPLPDATTRRNKLLGFDSGGSPIAYAVPDGGVFQGDFSLSTVTPANGEVALTIAEQLGYVANVRAFGAMGNGTDDDTEAFRKAAATGKPLYVPPGSYFITGKVTLSAAGQRLIGHGQDSRIILNGTFDAFEWTGNVQGGGAVGFRFDGANHTGAVLRVRNAHRLRFDDLRFIGPWVAMDLEQFNGCDIGHVVIDGWRGPRGIYWHGTDDTPSYVLRIKSLVGAPASGANGAGLEIDGACYTLDFDALEFNAAPSGLDNMTYGLWVRNTLGATVPFCFMYGHNLQVDFPVQDAVRFDAGISIKIVNLYAQGSKQARGVVVGENVTSVSITNPYIRGNALDGVQIAGQDVQITGGQVIMSSWSKLGHYDGVKILGTAQRVTLCGTQIGRVKGVGSPQRYGVYIAYGAQNVTVAGCDLTGNLLEPYRDDSGGPIGNVDVVGCGGVNHSRDGSTIFGSTVGMRAEATATVTGGVITAVTVTDGGFHYEAAPLVHAFDPAGTGSGAEFTATVSNGKVTGVTVVNGGSGYSADTVIYFVSLQGPPSIRALLPTVASQNLAVRAQGSGGVLIGNEQGFGLSVTAPNKNTVNRVQATGAESGSGPMLSAVGDDPDIDLRLTPKGAGRIRFGGYVATGDTAITGYIEIKDSSGNTRKLAVIS